MLFSFKSYTLTIGLLAGRIIYFFTLGHYPENLLNNKAVGIRLAIVIIFHKIAKAVSQKGLNQFSLPIWSSQV
jgi:hypothetical protein